MTIMNKGKYMVAACLAGLLIALTTACQADYEYQAPSLLTVTRSDVCFTAAAQEGYIRVRPTADLSATTSAAWCHVSIANDSTVIICVDRNTRQTGRSTEICLKGRDGDATVPVTQYGAVWYVMGDSTYVVSDDVSTLLIPIHSDYDYEVEQPVWASGEKVDDGYEITLHANRTGGIRRSEFTFSSEKGERTIAVYQFGPNDIAGQYELAYQKKISGAETVDTVVSVTITQSEADSTLFLADGMSVIPGVKIPFTYDPLTFTLTVTAGMSLGQVGSHQRYAFTALASEAGSHVSTSVSYHAPLRVDGVTRQPVFMFSDTEGFSFFDSNGEQQMAYIYGILTIGTVQDRASLDASNFLGYADRIFNPILRKK